MRTLAETEALKAPLERPPSPRDPLGRLASPQTGLRDPHYLVHRKLFAALADAASFARGALLDIGCGNKPYQILFAEKVKSYTGCDVAQSSLRCVDVVCEATSIPLPSSSFDTVLSTQTIEHVADHRGLISEAARLLKPGGHFILSGPMYWCLHEEPYDFFRFTKYGFEYALGLAGLKVVQIVPNGGPWSVCGLSLIHAMNCQDGKRRTVLALINKFFAALDDRNRSPLSTSNYVVIAQK